MITLRGNTGFPLPLTNLAILTWHTVCEYPAFLSTAFRETLQLSDLTTWMPLAQPANSGTSEDFQSPATIGYLHEVNSYLPSVRLTNMML